MNKIFENAEIEIIRLDSEDVICTSGVDEMGTGSTLPDLENGSEIFF